MQAGAHARMRMGTQAGAHAWARSRERATRCHDFVLARTVLRADAPVAWPPHAWSKDRANECHALEAVAPQRVRSPQIFLLTAAAGRETFGASLLAVTVRRTGGLAAGGQVARQSLTALCIAAPTLTLR